MIAPGGRPTASGPAGRSVCSSRRRWRVQRRLAKSVEALPLRGIGKCLEDAVLRRRRRVTRALAEQRILVSYSITRTRAGLRLSMLIAAALLLAGCGGGTATSSQSSVPSVSSSADAGTAAGTGTSSQPAGACPTENTRSFAKTRFVADLGGAAFLGKRYIYTPYRDGKFRKGASGRTIALVKAGVAAATTVKLLKNARDNAQANPTLCNSIAAPMSAVITSLGGVTSALKGGDLSALGGLGSALDNLRGLAGKAGVTVPEQQVGLNGS